MRLFAGVTDGLCGELNRVFGDSGDPIALVTLYEKLRIKTETSERSLIYHACPNEEHKPWYDSVLYQVCQEDDDGVEQNTFFCAGRLMVFVKVETVSGESSMMALVHAYCCAPPPPRGQPYCYDVNDPAALADRNILPLARMKFAYWNNNKPLLELIDTETISSALWVQEDFDLKGHFWFIQKK